MATNRRKFSSEFSHSCGADGIYENDTFPKVLLPPIHLLAMP